LVRQQKFAAVFIYQRTENRMVFPRPMALGQALDPGDDFNIEAVELRRQFVQNFLQVCDGHKRTGG
jgi:hypothetical protein